jgi:hypothetical protein
MDTYRWDALSDARPFRDCKANNIMYDPSEMYPQGFHPIQMDRSRDFKARAKRYTRTQRPPRYHLIDFGLSRQYHSRNALDVPLCGGDKPEPEHRNVTRCNPFYKDIYYLGNLVRREFIQVVLATPIIIRHNNTDGLLYKKYRGFEFMQDLVDEMTHINPAMRPLIEDVVARFSHIRKCLNGFKLRSPLISKHKPSLFTIFSHAKQAVLSLQYIFSRKAAVPEP